MAVRAQPMRVVRDVEMSSEWYQRLLGLRSAHGGPHYDQLVDDDTLVMQLHRLDVEDHHGATADPDRPLDANGALFWFEVDDFDAVEARAAEMKAVVVLPRHRNPAEGSGGPNHWELWLRDPDGALVVIASPYGTAGNDWTP